MSTPSTNNQGGSNIVNWINSIDLSKYPQLAQRVAAMNQIGLALTENYVLAETMEAQGAFIKGSVAGGFDSAQSTFIYGAAEAGMGVGQAASGGMQISSSIDSAKDINQLQSETSEALGNLNKEKKTDNLTIENADGDIPLHDMQGNNIRADEADPLTGSPIPKPPVNENKPDPATSEKRILSEHETNLEALKEKNKGTSSRAQIVQSLSQTGQLLAQSAQSNSQIGQTQQQVMNNNYSASQSAEQAANQALQQILQFDPYAQNVASSRA